MSLNISENITLFVAFKSALEGERYEECATLSLEIKSRLNVGLLSKEEVKFWFTRLDGRFDDSALNNVFSAATNEP